MTDRVRSALRHRAFARHNARIAVRVRDELDGGASLADVARRLEAEGVRTFYGRPWSRSYLCRVAGGPR